MTLVHKARLQHNPAAPSIKPTFMKKPKMDASVIINLASAHEYTWRRTERTARREGRRRRAHRIQTLDWQRLTALAECEPDYLHLRQATR